MSTRAAFAQGWHDAALGLLPAESSARDALALHPDLVVAELDAYLNGAEDGARGDRWRLDQ